jgi:light-regulated signal transduction histidine kinase (bacteriophytochrome)
MMSEDCAAKLDAEGNRQLDLIRAGAQRMGKLIDDLLAFSRMGRREMSISSVNMTQLARTVWEEMRGAIGERAVKVVIDEMPGARADRAMIQVVFTNLLSNALKFTAPRREAAIEIGATPGDRENTYHVRDNGVGFDEQYAHKLFGVFQRLHREEEFPGTGVGLALVQRIIQRHGGRVRAEGKTDEGATFYFTLPRTGDRP